MSRIKIQDLPINQDLSEAEARGLKAGAVLPGLSPQFSVTKISVPLPSGGLTLFNVNPIASKLGNVMEDTPVAGIRC